MSLEVCMYVGPAEPVEARRDLLKLAVEAKLWSEEAESTCGALGTALGDPKRGSLCRMARSGEGAARFIPALD